MRRSGHTAVLLALIGIMFFGLALRLYRLDAQVLRGDEAFAIEYWAAPWPDALQLTDREPHPLGTFALFALWRGIFGDGEWIMRLLPALLNVIGIPAIYRLGKTLFQEHRPALLAAALYSVHPYLIWYAQDVRNYAIWSAMNLAVMAAFLLALKNGSRRAWPRYVLLAAAAAYIFFLEAFFIAAQGMIVLIFRRDRWKNWLPVYTGLAILLIPWLVQLYALSSSGYGGTAGERDLGELFTRFLPVLMFGEVLPDALAGVLWPGVLLLLVVAFVLTVRMIRREHAVFIGLSLSLPVIALVVVSVKMNVFQPHYVIPLSVIFLLLVVGLFLFLTTRNNRILASIGWLLLGTIIAVNAAALFTYHTGYVKASDWRTVGRYLTDHTTAEDIVIQQALDPAFTYYFRGPADETALPLSANAPAADTHAVLEDIAAQYESIWLLPADIPWYDADRVPLTWLTDNMQQTADLTIAGAPLLEFRTWAVPAEEYTPIAPVQFGEVASLVGWDVNFLTPQTMRVLLYWEPMTQTETPLNGFAHLIGPPQTDGSPLWAQDDQTVPNAQTSTTTWQSGRVYRSVFTIPLPTACPAADWVLHVGLYNPVGLTRIPTPNSDHIAIPLSPLPCSERVQ